MMSNDNLNKAAEILKSGGLVAIPTETVYGLAANALDKEAVVKIFIAKDRPFFDPLILHTNSIEKVRTFVEEIPETALLLASKFWPGPLTLLLPKKQIIPDIVTSGLTNVAIRIPNHELTLELLSELDFPLAAPSANPFGYVSPTSAAHVEAQLADKVDMILDGGECNVGIESTIVGFDGDDVIVHRLGGLEIESIEETIGAKVIMSINHSSDPKAPGQLKSHYAPLKKLIVSDNVANVLKENKNIGVISFTKNYNLENTAHSQILSPKGDLAEAAHNLFGAIRNLDKENVDFIVAEIFPNSLLGMAINDRLARAAG